MNIHLCSAQHHRKSQTLNISEHRRPNTGWPGPDESNRTSSESHSLLVSVSHVELHHIQIKLRWALFVTYTIIQSIMRSEMCSLHLTHPSGAVGSRHCGARGAVGGSVPCSRVSPQSWTLPARAGIRSHNLGLPRVSSPTLYPLGHDCPISPGW